MSSSPYHLCNWIFLLSCLIWLFQALHKNGEPQVRSAGPGAKVMQMGALSGILALTSGLAGASWSLGAPLRGLPPREAARFHSWVRVSFLPSALPTAVCGHPLPAAPPVSSRCPPASAGRPYVSPQHPGLRGHTNGLSQHPLDE